jgi:hypothetical protein
MSLGAKKIRTPFVLSIPGILAGVGRPIYSVVDNDSAATGATHRKAARIPKNAEEPDG